MGIYGMVTGKAGKSGFGSASTAEDVTQSIDANHLTVIVTEHPNDEEEVEGIDLHQQRYPWEGSDMDTYTTRTAKASQLMIVNERHKHGTYVYSTRHVAVSADPLIPLWRLTCNVLTWKSLFGSYISRHFLNI
ncbi:hypothetical protein F2Q69_00040162 [Brassica cretica]|uniref:Uncharacterized protein n=1 Tax=Brassica cretica TaxID=69181 RepID=A0A8S9NFN4_BRACR|nr:hypothetical protein F2Q69_00040162 [Brassica cretica]